jgi:transcriptional regulator with PAS, ATPase and Fis domain
LQERTIERVGGNEPISVDIRIVAATKVELENLVKKNKFREDLFYRLNIINLKLPKLSKRKGDILLLANYFLKKASNDKEMSFSAGAVEKLLSYKWPGNIRELENAVTRAVILASPETEITANFVPPCETFERGGDTGMFLLSSALEKTEKRTIEAALMKADGVKTAAAEILGISRKHLWDRMKKLGIDYKADGSDDGA